MADGKCRITGHPLDVCIDLGNQFVTDFVEPGQERLGAKGSLRLGIGPKSGVVQLYESFPPESMYRRYWYRSGINDSMRTELRSIVESAMSFVRLRPGDTVLDIASNDGTLLSYYPHDVNRIGIDPSNVAAESELYGGKITLVNDFFSEAAFRTVRQDKAKIVSVIAMFYDLEDPLGFLQQVRRIIDDRGVLTIQLSYTPLMLEQNEFGNICHEHVCYYTLGNLKPLLDEAGFEVFDVQINPTNGGSIRVYATPKGSTKYLSCPLNWISIGRARVQGTLEYETHEKLNSPEPYVRFMQRVERLKRETVDWLQKQVECGKKVIGYGASTKGNVLLQYYGITTDLLPYIAEANMKKWGLCTVGTGIPIVSEAEMRKMKPDYLLVFPWFFTSYFMERERDLLASGTQLVMPQPELRVVESDFADRKLARAA
jgi:hypothetical protein